MDLTSSSQHVSEDDTRPSSTFSISPSATPVTSVTSVTPVLSASNQRINTPPANTSNKMYSKNSNGTVVLTSVPSNDAELQLYRVMQRASLLAYYDTLLEMGGDDVQQLCDAGEEEFLEIMALVGMASKPLHVRRFQKSLQEWMIDPGVFQVPLPGIQPSSEILINLQHHLPQHQNQHQQNVVCCTRRSILDNSSTRSININNQSETASCSSPNFTNSNKSSSSRSSSPLDNTPATSSNVQMLSDNHIERLRNAAERISKQLPQFEPKSHNTKRKVCKELDTIISMAIGDPQRMDSIRRYAAIYGRFDCKRRPEKPLTLHEVSVNEAAAQLCHFVPALLTRRDELFPLARQVVRDSGTYMYAGMTLGSMIGNGKTSWNRRKSNDSEQNDEPPPKKIATPEKVNTTTA